MRDALGGAGLPIDDSHSGLVYLAMAEAQACPRMAWLTMLASSAFAALIAMLLQHFEISVERNVASIEPDHARAGW